MQFLDRSAMPFLPETGRSRGEFTVLVDGSGQIVLPVRARRIHAFPAFVTPWPLSFFGRAACRAERDHVRAAACTPTAAINAFTECRASTHIDHGGTPHVRFRRTSCSFRRRLPVRRRQCGRRRRHVPHLRRHDAGRPAADRRPTPPRRSRSFPATSPRRSPTGATSSISGAARWLLCLISAVGALAGALILLALDNPSFRAMVPWLLLAATALFAAGHG